VLDAVLNVDRALWLCAFEIIFSDDDGYVNKRGNDYCLYCEPEGDQGAGGCAAGCLPVVKQDNSWYEDRQKKCAKGLAA